MQKTKRSRFVVVAIVIFSMVAMYGFMPTVNAANMDEASIKLGDSDISATATSTVTVDLGTALIAGQYIRVDFTNAFSGATLSNGSIVCPNSGTASTTGGYIVDCTGALASTSAQEILINIQNPGTTGEKLITISTHESNGTEIESSQVAVFIIDDVTVTAHVNATLTFGISGTSTGAIVNGATTTIDTSGSSVTIPFGSLTADTQYLAGQDLTVETNAASGYTVTVVQSSDMTSGAGATIDAFIDGTPDAGSVWQSPAATLDTPTTYGHLGLTADDAGLAQLSYVGLTTGSAQTVMSHTGPADGASAGIGYASVAYSLEVSSLQEAGDYESSLTYVCTPTY